MSKYQMTRIAESSLTGNRHDVGRMILSGLSLSLSPAQLQGCYQPHHCSRHSGTLRNVHVQGLTPPCLKMAKSFKVQRAVVKDKLTAHT
jgi:hypothetical protein